MSNSDNNSSVTPNNFESLESAIASQINTTWREIYLFLIRKSFNDNLSASFITKLLHKDFLIKNRIIV